MAAAAAAASRDGHSAWDGSRDGHAPTRLAPEAPKAAEARAPPIAPPPALPSGLRVLVADDMKIHRLILLQRLEAILPQPCTIVQASSGEEALAALTAGPRFDLAFLDEVFSIEQEGGRHRTGYAHEGGATGAGDAAASGATDEQGLSGGGGGMRGSQVAQRWRTVEATESGRSGPPLLIIGCSASPAAAAAENRGPGSKASAHSEQDAVWAKPLPPEKQMRAALAALLAARSASSGFGWGLWT